MSLSTVLTFYELNLSNYGFYILLGVKLSKIPRHSVRFLIFTQKGQIPNFTTSTSNISRFRINFRHHSFYHRRGRIFKNPSFEDAYGIKGTVKASVNISRFFPLWFRLDGLVSFSYFIYRLPVYT